MSKNLYKYLASMVFFFTIVGVIPTGLSGCATSGYDRLPSDQREAARRVEDYLNSLLSLEADFSQEGPDEHQRTGHLIYTVKSLKLDYVHPNGMTLVAKEGRITLDDPSTGAVTKLSLRHNPLRFFLRHPVQFSDHVQITNVRRKQNSLQLSLAEANNPSQGLLTVQFSDINGRLLLIGLQGVDAHGRSFSLSLSNVKEEVSTAVDEFSPSSSAQ